MNTHTTGSPEHLRADAEGRLRSGAVPRSAGWTIGAEALSLLYRLASDPERSGDAQKLLHELQTHQVELDLQHLQLAESEGELARQLGHFECLYQQAPAAYLVLGLDGRILRANRRAQDLLGPGRDGIEGILLTSLLSSDNASSIRSALENAGHGSATETVQAQTTGLLGLRLLVSMAPARDALLVLLLPENPPAGT